MIFIVFHCCLAMADVNEKQENDEDQTEPRTVSQTQNNPESLYVPVDGKETLARARVLYDYGQYPEMVDLLDDGLKKSIFADSDLEEVNRFLGIGYFIINNSPKSSEHFLRMLTKNPDAGLDPASVPPTIIKHFEKIKNENRALLDIIRAQKNDAPTKVRLERIHNPYFVNFIPFGAGQFQNKEPTKGALFLSGQLLALGINVTAYFVSLNLESYDGYYSAGNSERAKQWRIVQYTSLGVLVALMVGGVIDAVIHHEPFTFVEVKQDVTNSNDTGAIVEPVN